MCFVLEMLNLKCPGDIQMKVSRQLKSWNWGSAGKQSTLQCRRHHLDPWAGKILWKREGLPIPVFFHGEFHGERSRQATVRGFPFHFQTS